MKTSAQFRQAIEKLEGERAWALRTLPKLQRRVEEDMQELREVEELPLLIDQELQGLRHELLAVIRQRLHNAAARMTHE